MCLKLLKLLNERHLSVFKTLGVAPGPGLGLRREVRPRERRAERAHPRRLRVLRAADAPPRGPHAIWTEWVARATVFIYHF